MPLPWHYHCTRIHAYILTTWPSKSGNVCHASSGPAEIPIQRAGSGVWLWHPGILCAVLPWCSHATRRWFFLPTFACQPGVLLACLVNWKKRTDNNRQVNLEKARLLINGFQFWIYFMKSIRTVDCHARLKQKQNIALKFETCWFGASHGKLTASRSEHRPTVLPAISCNHLHSGVIWDLFYPPCFAYNRGSVQWFTRMLETALPWAILSLRSPGEGIQTQAGGVYLTSDMLLNSWTFEFTSLPQDQLGWSGMFSFRFLEASIMPLPFCHGPPGMPLVADLQVLPSPPGNKTHKWKHVDAAIKVIAVSWPTVVRCSRAPLGSIISWTV